MREHRHDSFGTWLRKEMTARGYDVNSPRGGGRSMLASEAGLNISVITRILADERRPEIDTLRKIGSVLGYSLAQMMVNAGLADADEMSQPIPAGVVDESHWWLGRQLIARRVALDPFYAPRAVFAHAIADLDLDLDEQVLAEVENGRLAVGDLLAAQLDTAYGLNPGSVKGFLTQGTPLMPADARHVTGAAYMSAISGASVAAASGEVLVLDLRDAPDDASEDVKAYWDNYTTAQRMIWHLPIPRWERQHLLDSLTAVREALRKARGEQRGGNGEPRAS